MHAPFKVQWTRIKKQKQFAVYNSDIPATLKWGQGHQTWYEFLDPKQGYNHAKFERSPLNRVHKNANIKAFLKSENMSNISLAYVQRSNKVVYSLSTWHRKFQLDWIRTQNFQLKPFVVAVTMKYGQGHWKWYEQVKLSE